MNQAEERELIKTDLANHWTPALVREPFEANEFYRAKLIAQDVISKVITGYINNARLEEVETYYTDEVTRRRVLVYLQETGWDAKWHTAGGEGSYMLAVQEKK